MSSPKRTRSPSGEHPDPHTVESPISVQEEITESEQELMSADDEARTPGKSSRSVNDKTVCWKFFAVPPKGTFGSKIYLVIFAVVNGSSSGLNFGQVSARHSACFANKC